MAFYHTYDVPTLEILKITTCRMEGYTKVAQLMACQDEFAILRRFKALNLQNLLYLQAEITHLEAELAELAHRDLRHSSREYFNKDWWSLSQGEDEEDREQWKKFEELRAKLEIYSMLSLVYPILGFDP
jgi:hypothetical protein